MSWSRLKLAALAATTMLPVLFWGGCLGDNVMWKAMQYAAVGNIFD